MTARRSTTRASAARATAAPRRRRAGADAGQPFNWRVVGILVATLSMAAGIIGELAVLLPSGAVGEPTRRAISLAVGWTAPLLPLWLIVIGALALVKLTRAEVTIPAGRLAGALLAHLALIGLFHLIPIGGPGSLVRAQQGEGGGLVGFGLGTGLSDAMGTASAVLLLITGFVLGILLAINVTVTQAVQVLARLVTGVVMALVAAGKEARARQRQAVKINTPVERPEATLPEKITKLVRRAPRTAVTPAVVEPPAVEEPPMPPPRRGSEIWRIPPLSLFEVGTATEQSPVDVKLRAKTIEETLASFNIDARVIEVSQGPTVTQFGIEPGPGVPVRKILSLQNDMGLRLGAWPVRFEAPVPGRHVVGLEVPNQSVSLVTIRGLFESEEANRVKSKLKLPLGRDVSGRPIVGDLARMPHLLIAGATGSGKSVCINTVLAALLSQNTPDDLQLMMIDPKMVELMPFSGIPHLRMPVVTDMDKVVGALKWVVREMERRYALFVQHSARNIESFNRNLDPQGVERPLPYLVVVIDELADMMMTAADEVEILLCRLAQKARATGIHLIVATQRPSVDVLTGMIKANFVTRIAFAVSSQVDSRVILDTVGAEKLLGRGDMLYSSGDVAKPVRVQGAWVSDQELQRLVTYWRRQGLPRYTEGDVEEMTTLSQSSEQDEGDELYERALGVANQYSRISTSLLQRRLGIGYPRAARLIDLMEERGVISSSEDGKSREVVARAEAAEEV